MWSDRIRDFVRSFDGMMTIASAAAIACYLILWYAVFGQDESRWLIANIPLIVVIAVGGIPLVWRIIRNLIARSPGADVLAGIAVVSSCLAQEWLVGAIIVLMMAGGEALEATATKRASAVLDALARRAPTIAHRVPADGGAPVDLEVSALDVGDRIVIFPHEICPVDGEVVDGRGTMDESFLTGEPYVITKGVGSQVLSGAINGESALTVQATKRASDSRYAQIVGVLKGAEEDRPAMRRMADRLGAWYAVLALALGVIGWLLGDFDRFLSVMVIATPCPLLIAVPVAIIGAISLAAKYGIIIKDPGVLERIPTCRAMMFDKTGTLTYGRPTLTELIAASDMDANRVLKLAAALEGYSRHPLSKPVLDAAAKLDGEPAGQVESVSERPGTGLAGRIDGHDIVITSPSKAMDLLAESGSDPNAVVRGIGAMEAVVLVDGAYGATMRFRDEPRIGASDFVGHLGPAHGVVKTMLISGDKSSEVAYVGETVGVDEIHAGCTPEEKLAIVRAETEQYPTLFMGDGINDAPAMAAASVGVAFGQNSDITAEAAGAVVLDSSLERLDELLHIGNRMRRIALQSAIGGIGLSVIGMVFAMFGYLPPVAGAVLQEVIDMVAILNAARVAAKRQPMADYAPPRPETDDALLTHVEEGARAA